MRNHFFGLLLLCTGCVEMEFKLREPASRKDDTSALAAVVTPITADQVTPANARQMCDALWAEMDRDELKR
jgi:hypothetical protein